MKKSFIYLSLMFSIAYPTASYSFTTRDVLEALNNACGDSWCEGDSEIDFMDAKFCNGNLYINMEIEGFSKSCQLEGYSQPEDVLYQHPDFFSPQLALPFYDEFSTCITKLIYEK